MNRGGRGWEPPLPFSVVMVDPAEMLRRQIEAQAKHEQWLREQAYRQAGIIDMVQVNGVWMTQEEAARV